MARFVHNNLQNIRAGDQLVRSCGERWLMMGSKGRTYHTKSNVLSIISLKPGGAMAHARCPLSMEYGDVDVITGVVFRVPILEQYSSIIFLTSPGLFFCVH